MLFLKPQFPVCWLTSLEKSQLISIFLTEMWEDRKKIRLFISETTFIIRDEKLSIINTMYHEVKNAALNKNY